MTTLRRTNIALGIVFVLLDSAIDGRCRPRADLPTSKLDSSEQWKKSQLPSPEGLLNESHSNADLILYESFADQGKFLGFNNSRITEAGKGLAVTQQSLKNSALRESQKPDEFESPLKKPQPSISASSVHSNKQIKKNSFHRSSNLSIQKPASLGDDIKDSKTDKPTAFFNENIDGFSDYYFVDEIGLRDSKDDVIINLKGMISTYENLNDDEGEADYEGPSGKTFHPEEALDGSRSDGTVPSITVKIRSESSSADPGGLQTAHTEGIQAFRDDSSHQKATYSEAEVWGTQNLIRKRRQKVPPIEGADHQRKGGYFRRRRKRKRRHRHSFRSMEGSKETRNRDLRHKEKFFLRSYDPAYVITNAKEVKKDWCRTVQLKQKIVEENCKPKVILNNFCYGQCNSFFIPHTGKEGNGAAFQSCAFCKPLKPKWMNVTLQCLGQFRPTVTKQVLLIESCRCSTENLD